MSVGVPERDLLCKRREKRERERENKRRTKYNTKLHTRTLGTSEKQDMFFFVLHLRVMVEWVG